jgi:exonuclease SbcC
MKLKRLALRNIRSYKDAEVQFPDGISLFSGDIGTGKSTILYAIELALFGPAEGETRKKTDFYLRGDAKDGWVRLDLELNGKEISFHRELTKTGSGKCKIMMDGGFTEYAPSEMRKKALEILGFNEPTGARATSVIYRYAVFTPQEDMKEILRMKEDDRIQTLRKAFRIEEYKTARENVETAARHFKGRASALGDLERELSELRSTMQDRQEAGERLAQELALKERELEKALAVLQELETEVARLDGARELRERLSSEAGRQLDAVRRLSEWLSDAEEQAAALRADGKRLEELRPAVEADRAQEARLDELETAVEERHSLSRNLAVQKQKLEHVQDRLERLEDHRKRLRTVVERLAEIGPETEQLPSVEGRLEGLQNEDARLGGKLESVRSKIEELEDEKRGHRALEKGQKCPKCGQELSAAHMEKMLSDIERKLEAHCSEREKLAQKLKERQKGVRECQNRLSELREMQSEQRSLDGELKRLEKDLDEAPALERSGEVLGHDIRGLEERLSDRTAEKEAGRLRALRPEWERRRSELSRLEERAEALRRNERQTAQRRSELEKARAALAKAQADLAQAESSYDEKAHRSRREERDAAFSSLGFLKGTVGELGRRREDNAAELGRLASGIREKEARLAELVRCREAHAWLTEFFGPALESIERHVLGNINAEFDSLFRKWFGMLVEGTELDVTIDENFTPVVNQGGYELDIWSLSGGEKTSVALAYRLALNHMVKEVSGVDPSNLLILDEPTDGFSAEQLSKVRDVLREVGAPQLIIVSHERELEGFADHLFRVVKENGASRVETVRG